MKIVVCVKETEGELSPFDQSAVECALELSDDVTVISMGRPSAKDVLLRLTRLGCKAVLLTDSAFAGADTLATAYALSLAVKRIGADLIICGRQSVDGDTAQTGPALATMLGYSLATNVMDFKADEEQITLSTRMGECTLDYPALITVERIRNLRFAKLRSKLDEVEVLSAQDIGADISRCGLKGSPTRVMKTFESAVGKRKCKFIQPNELEDVIQEGLKKRAEKLAPTVSQTPLTLVWCVGEEVVSAAKTVAKEIKVIPRDSAERLAEIIKEKGCEFVLWPADLWGRSVAPQVQALLDTGLCADCTALETDGKDLFMYRPAFSGTLTAKIRCATRPAMATVRLASGGDAQVILSCGKGVKDILPQMEAAANNMGAQLAGSRGIVDSGYMPYSAQIGLTGRSVGCDVYIAVGISGAVHHTCALDRVGTVIAINPDKDARIFEYADYGIVASAEEVFL
ncbi:MAG: FAD-binding protein [Clostridia bacterium]|nr:FAD-binding protein [Clostridia bacterium]